MLVEPGKHCRAREKATSSSRCASGISAAGKHFDLLYVRYAYYYEWCAAKRVV